MFSCEHSIIHETQRNGKADHGAGLAGLPGSSRRAGLAVIGEVSYSIVTFPPRIDQASQ